MPEPLRILVVDDEPLARQRVLDLLARAAEVEVVGTAGTGRQAVAAIASAISAGVRLPMSRPIGAYTLRNFSFGEPSLIRG